jgi:predicted hydrocarbon binding protein
MVVALLFHLDIQEATMAEKTVSNIVIRSILDATREVLGENGLKALLNYAGMAYILGGTPDYSFAKNYEEREFSTLAASYYSILGTSGAKALFRLIGKAIGAKVIASGVFDSLKDAPIDEKSLKVVELYAMATGKGTVFREGETIVYDNPQCTACQGLKDDTPVCTAQNGMFDEFFKWAGVKGKRTVETKCFAIGDKTCRYELLPIE